MISQILSAIELSPLTLAFCVVFVVLGGYLKGFAGFGASMFWMTSLSLVIPPLQLVPMVLMFEVATSIYLLPGIWKKIDWRSIGFLLAGTWIATPAGIYVLITLPAAPVRIALALVVLLAAIMLLRGFSLEKVPGKTATVGVGMAAGVLNGSHGHSRPPGRALLFFVAGGYDHRSRLGHHLSHRYRYRRYGNVRSARPDRPFNLLANRAVPATAVSGIINRQQGFYKNRPG